MECSLPVTDASEMQESIGRGGGGGKVSGKDLAMYECIHTKV